MSRKTDYQNLAITWLTGQADAAQAEQFATLMETDAEFRALVTELEGWLSPLNAQTANETPPPWVLDNIMAAIETDETANDNSARGWKILAITSSLIAVAALAGHLISLGAPREAPQTTQTPPPAQEAVDNTPALMALLSDSEAPPLVAIVYNPQTGKVVARLSNVTVPSEKDLELWLIREGGAGPVSLGVMSGAANEQQLEFDISEELHDAGDTLAVSLEPAGGSVKASGPSGPVLYTGKVSALQRR